MENIPYALDVFVCVSVIMLKRQEFLKCKDASEVFTVACNIRGSLNLKEVHSKALGLFTKYCKKFMKDNCALEKNNPFERVGLALQSMSNSVQNKASVFVQKFKSFFPSNQT